MGAKFGGCGNNRVKAATKTNVAKTFSFFERLIVGIIAI
jgi:hypothetical protein